MPKPFAVFLILICLTGFAIGCANVEPILNAPTAVPLQQPPPVTPITPPAGIRAQLHSDPRIWPNQSEPLAPVSHPVQDGLTLCNRNPNPEEPIEAYATASAQFEAGLYVHVCGWREVGEPVQVIATLPDGSLIEETVETAQGSLNDKRTKRASFILERQSPELVGIYKVVFEGDGKRYSAEFEIILPTEPRLYTFRNGDTYLYGFEPDETVQLLRYDVSKVGSVSWESGSGISETLTLVAEQTITVEQDGTKSLPAFARNVGEPSGAEFHSHVVALSDKSGELSYGLSFPTTGWRVEESVLLDE